MTALKITLGAGRALLREDDATQTARYHALLQEGVAELDRGEGIEVSDIRAWLDALGSRPEPA